MYQNTDYSNAIIKQHTSRIRGTIRISLPVYIHVLMLVILLVAIACIVFMAAPFSQPITLKHIFIVKHNNRGNIIVKFWSNPKIKINLLENQNIFVIYEISSDRFLSSRRTIHWKLNNGYFSKKILGKVISRNPVIIEFPGSLSHLNNIKDETQILMSVETTGSRMRFQHYNYTLTK